MACFFLCVGLIVGALIKRDAPLTNTFINAINKQPTPTPKSIPYEPEYPSDYTLKQKEFLKNLADAALERTKKNITYDPAYFSMDYPMGDVPDNKGVCTDVIIRSYRKFDIDLQKLVHEDMRNNFSIYPKKWGLSKPDTNIDHRRVPNLMKFFSRFGEELVISESGLSYLPGDIVTWNLSSSVTHIGIVSSFITADEKIPLMIHNIGSGPKMDNILFEYEITGHYRYFGKDRNLTNISI